MMLPSDPQPRVAVGGMSMKRGFRALANLRIRLGASFTLSETITCLGKRHRACHSRTVGTSMTLRAGVDITT